MIASTFVSTPAFGIVVVVGIALTGATYKMARAAGRLEGLVKDHEDVLDDHEDRIRVLEHRPRGRPVKGRR